MYVGERSSVEKNPDDIKEDGNKEDRKEDGSREDGINPLRDPILGTMFPGGGLLLLTS